MSKKWNRYITAYLFLLPTLLGLVVFRLYPIGNGLLESFYYSYFEGGRMHQEFVGLENYSYLFTDPVFWNSLWVTLKFNLLVNPIQIVLALLLALLLTREKPGVNTIRSVFMIPIAISLPLACVIWRILLNPNQGVVNGFLGVFGIPQQPFFTDPTQALWGIIALATWKGVAFWMLFLVAGISDIPESVYEAARIDGAGWISRMWKITIPLLKPVLLFVTVADTSINFLLFTPMYLITRGGPQESTNVLMYEAYRSGFIYDNFGRSMSIVTVILVIVLIVVGLQFKMLQTEQV